MNILFVTIGGFKSPECEALVHRYLKLAGKFSTIEHIGLQLTRGQPEQQAQDQALLKLLDKRGTRAFVTVLDEHGKVFASRDFASSVERIKDSSHSEWIIAVGGAHGYGRAVVERAQLVWSLSPLTLPHELAAAVAAEQIFRALSIIHRHPYHND